MKSLPASLPQHIEQICWLVARGCLMLWFAAVLGYLSKLKYPDCFGQSLENCWFSGHKKCLHFFVFLLVKKFVRGPRLCKDL